MGESSPLHKIGLTISQRFPVGNLTGEGGISSDGDDIMVSSATFFF